MTVKFSIKRMILFILQLLISIGIFSGIIFSTLFFNYLLIWLLLVVIYLLNVIVTLIIYSQNRNNQAKFSWIYLVLFIPVIGHILFFIFGLDIKKKAELKLDLLPDYKISYYLDSIKSSGKETKNPVIQKMIRKKSSLTYGVNIELEKEGYNFYQKLIKELKKARKSIFIVTYIIKNSEISREIISILKKKQKEGVEVKWLIDDFGAIGKQRKYLKNLVKSKSFKIKMIGKIYYPFINYSSFSRNHQKFFIIDSSKVFSGGNNISDEYASLSPKYGHWIDINYIMQGPYINEYILHFFKLWKLIAKESIDVKNYLNYSNHNLLTNSQAILLTDSPSYNHSTIEDFLLIAFANARKSIKIATPYFTITKSLEKQLIIALKSGVEVTIYFPGLPDKPMVYKVGLSQLNKFIQFGLKVKIYDNHFLHSKMGVIDDEVAWLGTNNLDPRSMFSQYETVDILQGNVVSEINNIFEDYDKHSSNFHKKPYYERKYNKFENFFYDWVKTLI
ncbi:cardiolipin synthetase [Mycoplasmopsis canis UFG1]|uniref:phospholipase D-like domain-containing protein n=1 Tax=Mycoplasmopsis canis TaxID=29555 RepID=UPI00025B037B|nr:phospholipase D-like domain-containing protein [Mycoplasmopsis canis]EIE41684.1 cardiolipin synthetase [Mycoplasmopsis canis UFG1]